ncbi:MerR family transcriptional regulator [Ornithinimicrobium pekingense]|uniref:MerR family transcriptional regulator n=1 Tax=Ornithinimicrobium pekingense TaxID=384677 RepID=A0ABQ2FA28_9MICO|nr:MerR family transcriptional regulator [Ornithinimicrobium pekingense]GGK76086.1 MerR family transcriptional regulator [Ornithinimicrobium pekingense]
MTSTARADAGGAHGISIGAVLRQLQPDFPDLTISKIRYLETEGLITPERRSSGYRLFADSDIARLRFILTAQRDRFWPLKVIKDALDRLDRGLDVPGLTSPGDEAPTTGEEETGGEGSAVVTDLSAAALRRRRAIRLTPAELRERTGLDRAAYGQLTAFGLLQTDGSGRHQADDLDVATAAAVLARSGLEARHLRSFRIGADRELGLAQQILEPLRRRQARGAPGPDPDDVEAELLSTMLALHVALVRSGLSRGH